MRHNWSQELMDFAVQIYEETGSGNEVARKLCVSPGSAYRLLKHRGVNVPTWTDPKPGRQVVKGHEAEEVIADYLSGMKWSDLETKHGFGQYSMREAIRRAGIELKPRGATQKIIFEDEEKEMIRLSVEAGFTQAQIAVKMKCSQIVVSRVLRKNGIFAKKASGPGHGSWKGGRTVLDGYVKVRSDDFPEMRDSSGYIPEHRLEMARYLNRPLTKHETVHHIDGNRGHNHISNLQLRIGKHGASSAYACADCGSTRLNPVHLK